MRYILIYYRGGNSFDQYWIIMQHEGCYLTHILCKYWVFSTRKLLGIHICSAPSERLPVTRSDRTWVEEIEDHPILWWGCPTWDCMMHPHYSPIFLVLLLHQEACCICFYILFEIILCGSFTVSCTVALSTKIIAGDVVMVYLRFFFLVFCFAFIILGFHMLG